MEARSTTASAHNNDGAPKEFDRVIVEEFSVLDQNPKTPIDLN